MHGNSRNGPNQRRDRKSSDYESLWLAEFPRRQMICSPVVLVRSATSRQDFHVVAAPGEARGDLPGQLFSAAFEIASEPGDNNPQLHRFFGL